MSFSGVAAQVTSTGLSDAAEDWAEDKLQGIWSSESCGTLLTAPLLRSLAARFHLLSPQTKLRLLLALLSAPPPLLNSASDDIQKVLQHARASEIPEVVFCSSLLIYQHSADGSEHPFSVDIPCALSAGGLSRHDALPPAVPLSHPLSSLDSFLTAYLHQQQHPNPASSASADRVALPPPGCRSAHFTVRSSASAGNRASLQPPPEHIDSDPEEDAAISVPFPASFPTHHFSSAEHFPVPVLLDDAPSVPHRVSRVKRLEIDGSVSELGGSELSPKRQRSAAYSYQPPSPTTEPPANPESLQPDLGRQPPQPPPSSSSPSSASQPAPPTGTSEEPQVLASLLSSVLGH